MHPVGTRVKWTTGIEATLVSYHGDQAKWECTYYPDDWRREHDRYFYAPIQQSYNNNCVWIVEPPPMTTRQVTIDYLKGEDGSCCDFCGREDVECASVNVGNYAAICHVCAEQAVTAFRGSLTPLAAAPKPEATGFRIG